MVLRLCERRSPEKEDDRNGIGHIEREKYIEDNIKKVRVFCSLPILQMGKIHNYILCKTLPCGRIRIEGSKSDETEESGVGHRHCRGPLDSEEMAL